MHTLQCQFQLKLNKYRKADISVRVRERGGQLEMESDLSDGLLLHSISWPVMRGVLAGREITLIHFSAAQGITTAMH